MLTEEQRHFILMFVEDFDFRVVCNTMGIRQSVALKWFGDEEFKRARDTAHAAKIARLGYGPLLAIEDMHSLAHSDIGQVVFDERRQSLNDLPRNVRVAIKSVEFGTIVTVDGEVKTYPKKVTMHDKAAALAKVADWRGIAEHETVKPAGSALDGPKRISGLMIELIDPEAMARELAEGEKLLED